MFFYTFIPKLINMSLTASVAIVPVMLLRLLLKKVPKVISYALWGIVLFRLLCPVSVGSSLSFYNLFYAPTEESGALTSVIEYVPADIVHMEYPSVVLPVPDVSDAINEALPQGQEQLVADPMEAPMVIATYVWMAGVLAMVVYSVVSYLQLRRKLMIAVPLRDNIYIADDIKSPFVIGFIRPKVYLPCNLGEREQEYIVLHEQHHIRRLDHIIKALAFLALTIHWFNPLVWVAFVLANKDMEMSCDEAVIRKMGEDVRADYSASLLTLATGRRIIAGTPLAFGEGDTKGRIKNLGKWKKPAIWVIVIAGILCIVLAVCLLTNPSEDEGVNAGVTYYSGTVVDSAMSVVNEGDMEGRSYITLQCDDGDARLFWMAKNYDKPDVDLVGQYVIVQGEIESETGLLVATNISISDREISDSLDEAINQAILDHNYSPRYEGMLQVASFVQLSGGTEGVASPESEMKLVEKATVYGLAFHQVFRLEDGILIEEGGSHIPVVLTFAYDASEGFTLTKYWQPRDGSYYAKDIKAKFTGRPYPDTQKYIRQQIMDNYLQAMEYYQVGTDVLVNTLLDSIETKAKFTLLENLIESEDADVQILIHYGKDTLEYCFSEFLAGNQKDSRADVMAAICKKTISHWGEPLLMLDSDPPLNAQDWFDFYFEQALNLMDKHSDDEILEAYPASWLLLNMTGNLNTLPSWGISLEAKNAAPNGATIILSQHGGYLPYRLFYGADYSIEKYENNQWADVEPLTELVWFTWAATVPLDDSVSWNIDWSDTFGTLEPGLYRFCKGISDHRAPGESDYAVFYAEFTIE